MRYDIMIRNVSGWYEVLAEANTLKSMLSKFETLFHRNEDEGWEWFVRDNNTLETTRLF